MNGMKIQRCNYLPENEMAIIKDTNTLIHNIVDSELKQKQQELERYKNIIDELETYLQRKYCEYIDMESDDAFVISLVLDTLRELKGSDSNE